jgi:hypothetical protein
MKTKILIIAMLLCTFVVRASAQDTAVVKEKCKHYIGVAAGFTTGVGLSYRLYYKRFGTQVTFAPLMISKSNTYLSAGLTFLYRLKEYRLARFYLYESNHLWCNGYRYYDYNYNQHTRQNYSLNNGIGIDFELCMGKRLVMNFMASLLMIPFGSFHSPQNMDFIANFNKLNAAPLFAGTDCLKQSHPHTQKVSAMAQ